MMPDTGHRLVVGTRDLFILSTDDFVKPCQYALSLPVSMNNIKYVVISLCTNVVSRFLYGTYTGPFFPCLGGVERPPVICEPSWVTR